MEARSVLVIDDEEFWATRVKTAMPPECRADWATDQDFAEKFGPGCYDAVILDIAMGTKGTEVFAKLWAIDKRCPIIVFTALDKQSDDVLWFGDRNKPVAFKMPEDDTDMGLEEMVALLRQVHFKGPMELRALVVDDDPFCRKTYASWLGSCGIGEVKAIDSVGEAVPLMEEEDFDILILDTVFDGKTGATEEGVALVSRMAQEEVASPPTVFLVTMQDSGRQEHDRVAAGEIVIPNYDVFSHACELEMLYVDDERVFTEAVMRSIQRGPHYLMAS